MTRNRCHPRDLETVTHGAVSFSPVENQPLCPEAGARGLTGESGADGPLPGGEVNMRWPEAAMLAGLCSLPACNFDPIADLSGLSLSVSSWPCLDATQWKLYGFEGGALPVGHSRRLLAVPEPSLGVVGCDEAVVSVRWLSTRPEVAGFTPGESTREAWLTGLSAGETFISADVTLTDGRTIAAPLGGRGGPSAVRVVAGGPPPESREVLLEGAVELEPEPRCCDAAARAYLVFDVPAGGALDMVVDWDSVSNHVIAHMCRGEVAFPLGCVPIIDATQTGGQKPVSASTQTTAGPHTLWITNGGPGTERVRYQVGLVQDGQPTER